MSSFMRKKLDILISRDYFCIMNLSQDIRVRIESFSIGQTFGYADLGLNKKQYISAAKSLERLQSKGLIKKLSKGRFYKPEKTVFGELQPDYYEILRPYLFENGQRIAYETGVGLYNSLKLTTQMPFVIRIACNKRRITINNYAVKAKSVKSYVDVNDSNYQLLGLLDAIKDIKTIPDTSIKSIIGRLCALLKELNTFQQKEMINYALSYPPRVRALLGAILEDISVDIDLSSLVDSLNPMSKYKIRVPNDVLLSSSKWNIV